MSVDTEPQCIFKGSKFFWRTRNNIDINIVEHTKVGVYEVVLYEPAIDTEARRVYLDEKVLNSKLNSDEIEEQLSFAKRNSIPITDQFVAGIQNKSIIEYLKSRTNIDKYIQEEKVIEASFHFTETDLAAGITDSCLIIEKPEGLQPFVVKHHKILMVSVVLEVMAAMQDDKKALQDCCETASELSELVDPTLSVRERWRMPLVIGKVARRQQLNVGDRRIYKKFKENMKETEAAAAGGDVPTFLASSRKDSAASVVSIATPPFLLSRMRRGSKEEQEPTVSRGISTLYTDTANSRQRRSSITDEATKSVLKHHKGGYKRGGLVHRKRGAQIPRVGAKRSQGSRHSMQSANTSDESPEQEGGLTNAAAAAGNDSDNSDESDNEYKDNGISSHMQLLATGLLEQDEHNNSANYSVSQHVEKSNQIVAASIPTSATLTASAGDTVAYVAPAAMQCQGSAPEKLPAANTTTANTSITTTATDSTVLREQPDPSSGVPGTSSKYLDDSAPSCEGKARTKPTKRNSYFGSFIQMLTGSSKPPTTTSTSGSSGSTGSTTIQAAANRAQQDSSSHLAIPALTHFLGANSSCRIQPAQQ